MVSQNRITGHSDTQKKKFNTPSVSESRTEMTESETTRRDMIPVTEDTLENSADPTEKINPRQFGGTAKNANETTGILQLAELRINKIQKEMESCAALLSIYADPELDGDSKTDLFHQLDSSVTKINEWISTARFMDKPVFGQHIELDVCGRAMALSLLIASLTRETMTDSVAFETYRKTIGDKKGEIKEILTDINRSLEEGVDDGTEKGYDFNMFDPKLGFGVK